jgi:hypothetical protein
MSKIYVFNAKAALFSPTRLAGESEIKQILGLAELPENLRPILRQQVVPKELLAPLEKQRKRLRDYLITCATKHELLGWVTPPEHQREIIARVKSIQEEFLDSKTTLLQGYEEECAKYLEKIRKALSDFEQRDAFVDVLAGAQPHLSYVERQVRFEFLKPRAVELDPEEEEVVREGLYGQTLHDLEQSAEKGIAMKTTRARRKAVDELVQKLRGLKYFDPRYGHIADQLAEAVRQVKVGREKDYSPSESLLVTGVFTILKDGEALAQRVEHGEELFPVAVELDGEDVVEAEEMETALAVPAHDLLDGLDELLSAAEISVGSTEAVVEEDGEPEQGDPEKETNGQTDSQAGMFTW